MKSIARGALSFALLLLPSASPAQDWSTRFAGPCLGGTVHDFATFDGQTLVAGEFRYAGSTPAPFVARWTGSAWAPWANAFDGRVRHLAVAGGELFAVGDFVTGGTRPNGQPILLNGVARWSGTSWVAMQRGFTGTITDAGEHQGQFAVCGDITGLSAWGQAAVWTGAGWDIRNGANPIDEPRSIASDGVDLFIAAGARVFRWHFPNWEQVAGDLAGGTVLDLIHHDGALLAAGSFTAGVARRDGPSWVPLGDQTAGSVSRLCEVDGVLHALGSFKIGGTTTSGVHVWDGTTWTRVGGAIPSSRLLALGELDDRLAAAGFFHLGSGASQAHYVAVLEGGAWTHPENGTANGITGTVRALEKRGNNLYAGGSFTGAGPISVVNVSRWDGTQWHALGDGIVAGIYDLEWVGDILYAAAGTSALYAWDGTQWSQVPGPFRRTSTSIPGLGYLLGLGELEGDLLVCGEFDSIGTVGAAGVARWDGQEWHGFGEGVYGWADDVTVHQGDLYAAGQIGYGSEQSGNYFRAWGVARWTGTSWVSMGPFSEPYNDPCCFGWVAGAVYHMASVGPRLYACGLFARAGITACRNVTYRETGNWQSMPSVWGPTEDLGIHGFHDLGRVYGAVEHQGTLVITGRFQYVGDEVANGIARWNGDAWGVFGSGLFGGEGRVALSDGERLYVAGDFTEVDGTFSQGVAYMGEEPVPVRLGSFVAQWAGPAAEIRWRATADAADVAAYLLYRAAPGGARIPVPEPVGTEGDLYTVIDPHAPASGAAYWLGETSRNGTISWHGPATLPARESRPGLVLAQNEPNPFSSSTAIRFSLAGAGPVSLQILDASGRLVAEPCREDVLPAGLHSVTWDGRRSDGVLAAAGVYFYVLTSGPDRVTRRLVLVR